ncbi:MAG TPA: type II CRISPR RNA-guided endonuclease Cas9 [Clostridia bacterium]|nr:type II CRISPR RNA-guided endonuclease Cas9 [Clostridia bacterium]
MTRNVAIPEYTLGLDLGSASIGWALVALDSFHRPNGLLKAGVRIFEPGVEGSTLDIEQGKDKSKAVARREARLHRRQLRRRAARQRDLFLLLQRKGLLPAASDTSVDLSCQRHQVLNELDQVLAAALRHGIAPQDSAAVEQALPYYLRKLALDKKLTEPELGRILYHLIQRRGFKSNRREGKKQKDDIGQVKASISELSARMASSGARTLGEYFAGLNPHERRIRNRWTARSMYEQEFSLIWQVQQSHWPELLNEEFKAQLCELLFFQRPIAAQAHLIGFCELEPNERRASWASLEAQRFRILQKVNDLAVVAPGSLAETKLSTSERETVYALLDQEGDQTFAALRKKLGINKAHFNLERGGEKKLRGNRTNAMMRTVFRESWQELTSETQAEIVDRWAVTESEDEIVEWLKREWALDEVAARNLADNHPEDGYCSLSLKALRKVIPLLEGGKSYETVRRNLYPDLFKQKTPLDELPIVRKALPTLRNPAVERALTELRKVVNAIVGEYGKPYEIRIEMARELRKSRKEREEATRRIRANERQRIEAKKKIFDECRIDNPSRADIEKALLFDECGGICPYTGKSIEFSSLFGDSQFDVEHIIPLSRCPDDSFVNKTLCYHEENRSRKRGRTPWEAYSADEEQWDLIVQRVRSWQPGNEAKLRRFQLCSLEKLEEFTQRQMNDTRYTTRLAVDLLSTLYGGRDIQCGDGTSRRVIHATTGMVTATLRKSWGLEAILREAAPAASSERRGKPRTDHRHHAIDAITIALTSQAMVQRMSVAAAGAPGWQQDRRVFRGMESPWPNFVDSIRPAFERMTISHRPEHKLSGAFHDETNYGKPRLEGKKSYVHIRKPITALSEKDIANIVDPVVRRAVEEKFVLLGGDLSRCEATNDWPSLPATSGRIPIRKARIRKVLNVSTIGKGNRERFVMPSSNHHVEIFAELDANGKEVRWEPEIVSLLSAAERMQKGEPVVARVYPGTNEYAFKFSLMGGDTVELHRNCDHKAGCCVTEIYRLRSIEGAGVLFFVRATDARLIKDIALAKERWRPGADSLRRMDCRKVVVDLLGRVHPAND